MKPVSNHFIKTMDNSAPTASLRDRLKVHHLSAKNNLHQRYPNVKTFFEKKGLDLGKIRQHSAKALAAGALGGSLLLGSPIHTHAQGEQPLPVPAPIAKILTQSGSALPEPPQDWLVHSLNQILPPIENRLGYPFVNPDQEKTIGKIIEMATKIPAKATLEGEHLNTVYGYTGYEQHLQRYPGDVLSNHKSFLEAGMAPGLGGFGYFTDGGKFSDEVANRERWYMVAQLMYLPDWEKRLKYLVNWYKWRKVIMINVENGNAVVGDIGDAGPAAWTGKHFGASPEVMNALGGPKYRKGKVLLYFVDDPENKIPLGPVNYDKLDIPLIQPI